MNDIRAPWENKVKQGLFSEDPFTEEMHATVLKAVDRRRRLPFRSWNGVAAAIAVCLMAVLLVIRPWEGNDGSAASGDEGLAGVTNAQSFPAAFHPLDAQVLPAGATIRENDPDILPGLSDKYTPLRNGEYAQRIPESDIDLIERKEIPGFGMAIRYTLKSESTVTAPKVEKDGGKKIAYFGFKLDGQPEGTIVHFGTGHMYDLDFEMSRLFGQEVLKIAQAECRIDGESCVWYVRKGEGGVAELAMFSAASYERDLDGDGREEAIVATRKQNEIYVFKENGGKLSWTSVRNDLKAGPDDVVGYDESEGIFTLAREDSFASFRYSETDKSLVRIDD
ncbi:hypothetical protein ACFPPD_20865 [Cohnella suwonensis]|uniref:VCBS repeat-containing protein n=1 Tax=Cohnella suwonensis TaxID=696072 RepID=A0ABW0LZB3_9BACL